MEQWTRFHIAREFLYLLGVSSVMGYTLSEDTQTHPHCGKTHQQTCRQQKHVHRTFLVVPFSVLTNKAQ